LARHNHAVEGVRDAIAICSGAVGDAGVSGDTAIMLAKRILALLGKAG
jgi:hypothetical protein